MKVTRLCAANSSKPSGSGCGSGPEPLLRFFVTGSDETAFVLGRVKELHAEGVPFEEMTVLCRTNARLADFEEPFHEAEIPFFFPEAADARVVQSGRVRQDAHHQLLRESELDPLIIGVDATLGEVDDLIEVLLRRPPEQAHQ